MALKGKPKDWEGHTFIAHNPRSVVKVLEWRPRVRAVRVQYLGGDGPLPPQELLLDRITFADAYEPYDPATHGPINKPPGRRDLH